MSNVLTVSLYGDQAHIVVRVEALADGTFSLALSVNDKARIKPTGGFSTPHEALDHALTHYTGYPLSGVYVDGGEGELEAGAASEFIRSLELKGLRIFGRFLNELEVQYGIEISSEVEYRTAHVIWMNKGKLFDAAIAINKLRNAPMR